MSLRLFYLGWTTALLVAAALCTSALHSQPIRPDLDYFPSRLHATIYRNWDIVPHDRLAKVLETDVKTIHKAGKEMGLTVPEPLTTEELHRNTEIIIRRNWPLVPRQQIEGLLNFTPQQLDVFLGKEIFLRALLASPPPGLTPLKYTTPDDAAKDRLTWFAKRVGNHLRVVTNTVAEPRLGFKTELYRAHNPADYLFNILPAPGDSDLRSGWKIQIPSNSGEVLKNAAADFADYCQIIHQTKKLSITTGKGTPRKTIALSFDPNSGAPEAYALKIATNTITLQSTTEIGLARGLVELERRMAEGGGPRC